MILLSLLAASAAAALIVMLLIAGLNAITFPRLHPPQPDRSRPLIVPSAATPLVSILIPARDEATAIGATVRSLLAQTYAPFEVLILDDSSADGTGEIARRAAAGDPRFQVIAGEPLLAGWVGESWACHQLSLRAQGSVLIFAAADVQWQPEGLAALIAELQRTQADLLTVWATPITVTRGERLIVPLTALARFADLPALLVQHRSSATFAAATGQCLAFRRSAYQALGGHICVRDAALADLSFARQIKARGLRLRLADGAGLITCRRYRRWHDLRAGFAEQPACRLRQSCDIIRVINAVSSGDFRPARLVAADRLAAAAERQLPVGAAGTHAHGDQLARTDGGSHPPTLVRCHLAADLGAAADVDRAVGDLVAVAQAQSVTIDSASQRSSWRMLIAVWKAVSQL